MNGKHLNEVLGINARHALYRDDGQWYHHLKDFPGVLFDRKGYLLFNTAEEYNNHPNLQRAKDLHIKDGIAFLEGYVPFPEKFYREIILTVSKDIDEETTRILRQIGVIIRNIPLATSIKKKYNSCQVCSTVLKIRDGVFYSEIHHIKPLGGVHKGPDKSSNMICVCPNCHILLDYGVINLDVQNLKLLNHKIDNKYISYHNEFIKQKI